ncbi:hypothetical protein HYC85_011295 [Camellia sinensis]|uniref:DNA repair metallo-beta-lactamase domain-containing protein n=1 Tax=Camellia sinensis TaxID=4442 RepID=A0A7J7H8P3_CAMSI|nr:hypothetical protein HYC85_011295 [Camellia sinensis]
METRPSLLLSHHRQALLLEVPRFQALSASNFRYRSMKFNTLVSPTTESNTTVDVIPIDAHHRPGAVMYLFRGEFGCMLYTGDFRWETTSKRVEIGRSMLLSSLGNDEVDILYLDNTYCNPSYSFPSREVAAQQVAGVIASHLEHDIIISIDSLGKEDLLLHIAQALKIKVCSLFTERKSVS